MKFMSLEEFTKNLDLLLNSEPICITEGGRAVAVFMNFSEFESIVEKLEKSYKDVKHAEKDA